MATYGLVHGMGCRPAIWSRFAPLLEDRGHRVAAVDLPCEQQDAGWSDYVECVERALGDADDVVLVGHSLAGLTIPLVAASRPVERLVFVCAVLPQPGRTFREQLEEETDVTCPELGAAAGQDEQGRRIWHVEDPDSVVAALCADCSPQDADRVIGQLRPQGTAIYLEPCPLSTWPEVESTYVVCADDRTVNPEWSRRVVPDRLGIEPVELSGGHCPMLSRPQELLAAIE